MDGEGNLCAADIGITWEGNETFLHGVKVVGPQFPRPVGPGPIMSTPYQQDNGEDRSNSSTMAQPPTPVTPVLVPDADGHVRRPPPEVRQGYRPAAPIQRFNNKSLNWPSWFRHFRAVADVHGWSKDQRALQLVSYLDETAMNVAQELGDNDLCNYDVLVKLLSDRFNPASRVSAFRSRRHHEDADTFADALAELCRVGYPQICAQLPDKQTATDHLQELDRSRIRIVGSTIRNGPVGTIPESSTSIMVSLDTCGHDAQNRTRLCRTNLWVGKSNPIIVNNGMAITNRETPHRPGPYPTPVYICFI